MRTEALKLFVPAEPRRVETRRRWHWPFGSDPPGPGATYTVSTWDHEEGDWETYRAGVRLMALRGVIRELESAAWDPCSYLVERD